MMNISCFACIYLFESKLLFLSCCCLTVDVLTVRAKSKRYQDNTEEGNFSEKKSKSMFMKMKFKSLHRVVSFTFYSKKKQGEIEKKNVLNIISRGKTCEWGMARGSRVENSCEIGKYINSKGEKIFLSFFPQLNTKTFSHIHLKKRWISSHENASNINSSLKMLNHSLKISHECLIIRESHPSKFPSSFALCRRR